MATIVSNKNSSNIMIINVLALVFLISKSKVPKLTLHTVRKTCPHAQEVKNSYVGYIMQHMIWWRWEILHIICFILDGQMAMSLMKIPYIPQSHAIPISFPGPSLAKRSAGISKFDQVKFNFRILCGPNSKNIFRCWKDF